MYTTHRLMMHTYMTAVSHCTRMTTGTPAGSAYVATFATTETAITATRKCSAGTPATITIPVAGQVTIPSVGGSGYVGAACTVSSADALLHASSAGDGDGADATSWFSDAQLGTYFFVPVATDHVAVGCPSTTTVIGTIDGTAFSATGENGMTKYYIGNTNAKKYNAGIVITTAKPCYVVVDGNVDDREIPIMAYKSSAV